jgi:hypothetical protein
MAPRLPRRARRRGGRGACHASQGCVGGTMPVQFNMQEPGQRRCNAHSSMLSLRASLWLVHHKL